ncbi:hypothetical protein V6N11_016501 [Hibiscus sabdariffa]|uniref:HTH three-helical bundle domain-containing protein n=1 Tax=Hibiscus sabdariffa TaxID=183260 RepID=A0ABR2TVI4_9ROSI
MIGCCDGETKGETTTLISSTESESCSSSLTTHQSSSRKQQKLRIIAAAARCREIKLKVSLFLLCFSSFCCILFVFRQFPSSIIAEKPIDDSFCCSLIAMVIKKRRSRTYRSYDNRKISSFRSLISSNIAKAKTTSCSSNSSSSGISSARSQRKTNKAEKIQRMRRSGGPNHMRRRAEAILKLLSGGCFSEVNIRRVLGDSPDTSKALRMYSTLCLFSSLLRVTLISHPRVYFCKFVECTEDQCNESVFY